MLKLVRGILCKEIEDGKMRETRGEQLNGSRRMAKNKEVKQVTFGCRCVLTGRIEEKLRSKAPVK